MSEPHPSQRLVRRVLISVAVSALLLIGLLVWLLTSTTIETRVGTRIETGVEPGPERVRVGEAAPAAPLPARTPPPGTRAPELRLPTLDGGTVDLAGLRGRPVVVNFWAPDCAPCRKEFPLLRAADREHAADGLVLVGVTVRGSAADAQAFADQHHAGWTLAMDAGQRVAAAWQVAGIPQTFFIRPDGTVASHQLGELDEAGLDRQLAAILPEATAG